MSAGLRRIEWILPLGTLLLLTCIGWGGYVAIRAAMRDALRSQLSANLSANVGTLRRWIEHEHELAHVWASDPELRSIVPHQLALATNRVPGGDTLLTSTALSKLRTRLRPLCKSHDHEGFLIVNPRRVCVAAMDDSFIGQPVPVAAQTAIDRALSGETTICQPFLLREQTPLMLIATPVRDQHEAIVAALVLMIDPTGEFTAIFANSRIAEAGDSFAFDWQGRLLSASRFDQTFRQLGILPADDETSILRVRA
ncbi:MAG TPA: cache domain-containing protein, partial [Pirellulaceae bacterium]|nr:cache domain-containing protein [Pirellulaceae bacterium]